MVSEKRIYLKRINISRAAQAEVLQSKLNLSSCLGKNLENNILFAKGIIHYHSFMQKYVLSAFPQNKTPSSVISEMVGLFSQNTHNIPVSLTVQ